MGCMDWHHDDKWYGPSKEGLKAAIAEQRIIVEFSRLYGSTVYVRLKTLERQSSGDGHCFNFTGETITGNPVSGEIRYARSHHTEDHFHLEIGKPQSKSVKTR